MDQSNKNLWQHLRGQCAVCGTDFKISIADNFCSHKCYKVFLKNTAVESGERKKLRKKKNRTKGRSAKAKPPSALWDCLRE